MVIVIVPESSPAWTSTLSLHSFGLRFLSQKMQENFDFNIRQDGEKALRQMRMTRIRNRTQGPRHAPPLK